MNNARIFLKKAIDSTVVSTAGYRAFVPCFVLITLLNHEYGIKGDINVTPEPLCPLGVGENVISQQTLFYP